MWLHRFDVISQSIMSGHNNMLYKYYRNCSGIMHATFVTLWLQVMQPLANVHETKWTPHVKRETDVAVHIIAVVSSLINVATSPTIHLHTWLSCKIVLAGLNANKINNGIKCA